MRRILERLRDILRGKATNIVEYELNELENLFLLLLLGPFIGIPSPPSYITLRIFPLLLNDLKRIGDSTQKERTDIISELFGILEIG
jgi:hypothetical protein